MKKSLNLKHISYNMLFLLGIISLLLFYMFDIFYLKLLFGVIGNILFFYEIKEKKIDKGIQILLTILFTLVLATITKSIVFTTLQGLGNIPILIAHIGYSISIYKNKISIIVPTFLFVASTIYISINLLLGIDANEIFITRSRNHISIILLYLSILLYLNLIINKYKIWIWPSLITFMLSVLSIGRSGILTSLILLVLISLVLFYNFLPKLKKILAKITNIKLFFIPLLLMFMIFILINIDTLISFFAFDLRLSEMKYSEDKRFLIDKAYILAVDNIINFLFGFPYEQLTTFYKGYTIHNSFLNAHFRYGLYSFIIFIFIIYALIKGLKELNIFVIFLIVICIRGISDAIFIGESFDFIFFSLLTVLLTKRINFKLNYISKL